MHVHNVAAQTAAVAAAGLRTAAVRSGGKVLRDGRAWKVGVAELGRGIGRVEMPSLIEDLGPREVRVPPPTAAQPSGVQGIVGSTLLSDAFKAVAGDLATLFGPPAESAPRLFGAPRAAVFEFAGCWLELRAPVPGESELSAHLARFGAGVFEVTLGTRGAARPGDGALPDLVACHEGRLRVAGRGGG